MGVVKGAAILGAAGVGTVALYKALDNMDGDTIRSFADKVGDLVSSAGEYAKNSEIGQQIIDKLGETKYGPKAMEFVASAGDTLSDGFSRFIGTIADSKDAADANGTSLASELVPSLTGLVADGAEYVNEHLATAKEAVSNTLGFGTAEPTEEAEVQDEGPEVDI